jgi:FeS assembly SUF system regulator
VLKISKLSDYATVLMTELAQCPTAPSPVEYSASSMSERTALPVSTVAKLLKALSRSKLLVGSRGAHGGYSLAKPAEQITVAQILEAIEGPIGLTDCASDRCARAGSCRTKRPWQLINQALLSALQAITLADLARHALQVGSGTRDIERKLAI